MSPAISALTFAVRGEATEPFRIGVSRRTNSHVGFKGGDIYHRTRHHYSANLDRATVHGAVSQPANLYVGSEVESHRALIPTWPCESTTVEKGSHDCCCAA